MTEEAQVVDAQQGEEQVVQRDFDKEAREMGWVPETEFKGPKEKWKPAQNFVEDGEKILPIVRSQLEREKRERERDKADFAQRLERIEKINKTTFEAAQRSHEAEVSRLKGLQRAAVEAGDTKEYDRLETEKGNLEKAAPKVEETPAQTPEQAHAHRREKWVADNSWFNTDFDLRKFTMEYSEFYGSANPSKSFDEVMEVTKAEVQRRYPEKFDGKKPGNGHSAVDSGGDFSAIVPKKGLAAKLPAEARKQAAADIAAGRYKSEEAWAKVYFDQ